MISSYRSGDVETPLLRETIDANLRRTVLTFPDREAIVEMNTGRKITYADLNDAVDELARGMIAQGILKGDRVGIWAPNCLEWYLVQFATARVGAILVNINPSYRARELEFVLAQAGVSTLVSAVEIQTSNHRAMVDKVRGNLPDLRNIVFIGDSSWSELLASASGVSLEAIAERSRELFFDDPINIQYTSGTTGFPKGVTLSHHSILNNGFFVGELCRYTEHDRICVPVPFFHCFGMVMGNLASTTHGACVVIPSPTFEAQSALRAVQDEHCTSLYGVPTMFVAELALPNFTTFDLSSLRTGIMAGSPCPVEVMKRVVTEMHMNEVTICYGMTETSPVSTQTRTNDSLERRVSTVGSVHPHVEVKVIDPESGAIVAPDTAGEFCTRGYSVMMGYWNEPEMTSDVLRDGWMHTGDLATMDAEGYVQIVGRLKDMVIRGGENIYPREVEEFLYTHPDILENYVIGVPDERFGEELMVWVRLREGSTRLTPEALQEFCAGKIARYKIPRYVNVVEEFPMTATGKVRKVAMREVASTILSGLDA